MEFIEAEQTAFEDLPGVIRIEDLWMGDEPSCSAFDYRHGGVCKVFGEDEHPEAVAVMARTFKRLLLDAGLDLEDLPTERTNVSRKVAHR